jgi:hypothetical protein
VPKYITVHLFHCVQRRQEELERKAQELARREEELKNAPYNGKVYSEQKIVGLY